jgi:hypothetical protein
MKRRSSPKKKNNRSPLNSRGSRGESSRNQSANSRSRSRSKEISRDTTMQKGQYFNFSKKRTSVKISLNGKKSPSSEPRLLKLSPRREVLNKSQSKTLTMLPIDNPMASYTPKYKKTSKFFSNPVTPKIKARSRKNSKRISKILTINRGRS